MQGESDDSGDDYMWAPPGMEEDTTTEGEDPLLDDLDGAEVDEEDDDDDADYEDMSSEEDEGTITQEELYLRLLHGSGGRKNKNKALWANKSTVPDAEGFLADIGWRAHDATVRAEGVFDLLKKREQRESAPSLPIAAKFMPNTSTGVLERYGSRAYVGQFTRDGTAFLAGTQDFQLHLYDTSDVSKMHKKATIHAQVGRWTITDCEVSPDQSQIMYSSITPQVHLTPVHYDPEESQQTSLDFDQDDDDGFGIWSVRFSGDGREIVAGTSSHCLYVYDIESQRVLLKIRAHADDVNAVCFADASSSHVLYSASDDGFVKIWDRRSLGRDSRPAGVFVGHTEGITYVDSKDDGRYCLSNSKDQTMKMWDLRKCLESSQFDMKKDKTLDVGYFAEEWDYRISRYPGNPKAFRHPRDCSVQTFTGHRVLKTLIRCHFSPAFSTGQQYVYTGSEDGIVRIFDMEGKVVKELDTAHALPESSFRSMPLANSAIYEFLIPSRNRVPAVTRDVSWHPYLPYLISTSWCGTRGAYGAAVIHECQGT
ncbi:DDB1- and CUL4-associated factor 11 [Thoreauomyces humboldtii]|nr:DDB1- and CUL4-associated factor 11 [Thoreauomyces humboldtii]